MRTIHFPHLHTPPHIAPGVTVLSAVRHAIALVGAGPRGTSVLERLCASVPELAPDTPLTVHVIDAAPAGPGQVWRTDQPADLLMNTVASQVTLFTDESVDCEGPIRPGPSLYEWAAGRADEEGLGPDDYPTRACYGRYLEWAFRRTAARAPETVRVEVHRARAVRLDDAEDGSQRVALDDGTVLTGLGAVVLAQGHLPVTPGATSARLGDYAARHGLRYFAPANPADLDLSAIAPGETVLLRGLGLNFFDHMALLTTGRGGVFVREGDRVAYRPSGREPRLYAGSRRGIPYQARGDNAKGASGRHQPLVLTPDVIAVFRKRADAGDPPDFLGEIWPLVAKEVEMVYYEALLAPESGTGAGSPESGTQAGSPEFATGAGTGSSEFATGAGTGSSEFATGAGTGAGAGAGCGAGNATGAGTGAGAGAGCGARTATGAGTGSRLPGFRARFLDAPHGSPEEAAVLDAYGCPETDRWSWERVSYPHRGEDFAGPAAFRDWLLAHLRQDAEHAALGNVAGPVKAALDVLRDVRNEVRQIVDHAGLSGTSRRDHLDRWYTPLNAFLSIGPPRRRIEEMAALIEAGVLEVVGPRMTVRPEDGLFTAGSPDVPGSEVSATTLIEARLPEPDLRRSRDELLARLLRTGQCRPHAVGGYETGGLDVTERPYRLVDRQGRAHPRRFAVGVPTEGVHWVTAAGARPGVDSVTLADADAVARAVLRVMSPRCENPMKNDRPLNVELASID
ncbi:FAD/NAD(P)-binding protein [Streptomyces sp. NPDC059909]|uniref:FAD/NAD(P)-binding protein n=1 Tax=Streptomyces sp. NPDC059909 TaxID=3346998 RepID=UPI003647F482